jgi:enoyl-CoA hydratase/carnithine racemase
VDEEALEVPFDLRWREALATTASEVSADHEVKAVLLLPARGVLGSERYRAHLRRILSDPLAEVLLSRWEIALDELIKQVHAAPKVTAVGLQGEIATPFVGAALAMDFRYCTPDTILSLDSAGLEEPPGGAVGFFLPRFVGQGRASELLLSRRVLEAEEALRLGLVSDIVPERGFAEACAGMAEDAGRVSEGTAAETKALLEPDGDKALSRYLDKEFQEIRMAWRRSALGRGEKA